MPYKWMREYRESLPLDLPTHPYGTLPKGVWKSQDRYNNSPEGIAKRITRANDPLTPIKKLEYKHRPEVMARTKITEKRRKVKLRTEVLTAYGGKCKCCGEGRINFLSMDHINGGGVEDRRKYSAGKGWYRYLRDNHPDRVQILCYNCNMSKGHYGVCPHKNEDYTFIFDSNFAGNRVRFLEET